jgi:rod shape-determining protein MreD
MSIGLYAIIPLVILLAILQATLLHALPIFGIVPGLWLVVAVGWGLFRGMREGLLVAFVGGLFIDLLSSAPLGATSLSLMSAIVVATTLQRHLPKNQTLMPALLTALATILFWFIYLLILRLIMPAVIGSQHVLGITELRAGGARNSVLNDIGRGYGLSASLLRLMIKSAIIHALLVVPFYWLINTVQRLYGRRRVEI